jgi:hypothetical protein
VNDQSMDLRSTFLVLVQTLTENQITYAFT